MCACFFVVREIFMNIFSEAKRIIAQFFETEYWYRFRKFKNGYYLARTWEGEDDILTIMLMKIEHMFWNLKRHSMCAEFYINSCDIVRNFERISDTDKYWALKLIFQKHFDSKFDKLFLMNSESNESDSGLCHYYLVCENKKTFKIIHKTDLQIPPNEIPKNKKVYEFDFEKLKNGEKGKEAAQYKTKCVYEDLRIEKELDFSSGKDIFAFLIDLQSMIEDKNIPINNLIENIIRSEQSLNVSIQDYATLSPIVKNLVCGSRRTLTQLLHLRHLIRNIQNIDFSDDDNMTSEQILLLYKADRKKAYREIADFMAEYGDYWWD